MEKVCFKCGRLLPLSSFYKHSRMADGHLNKCKDCTRKDTNVNRKEKEDYYKEYDRNRPNHEGRIVNNRERQKELKESDPETFHIKRKLRQDTYRDNHPDKYKAHCCVNNAIKYGKLQKKCFCENCSSDYKVQAHHESYEEENWLDVVWLCDRCHKKRHRTINKYIRNNEAVPELTIPF